MGGESNYLASMGIAQQAPDAREPTSERQVELQTAYEANVSTGKTPFAGVSIRTLGELNWIMRERTWSGDLLLAAGYERADLRNADLILANLCGAYLCGADLRGAHLGGAVLNSAYLTLANLGGADLVTTNLREADLRLANLCGAYLTGADLRGAHLGSAGMDAATRLEGAHLDDHSRLADVVWNGVPLTRLNWEDVPVLGDERVARDPKDAFGKSKDKATKLRDHADAVLANRQVSTVLRSQGLNEHADRFAYRAQLCQRRLLCLQRHYLRYVGSLFLALIAGYGYRPLRSFATYLAVVLGFAAIYFILALIGDQHVLTWNEAIVVSMTAFHGRGFFSAVFQPGDLLAAIAAIEAFIGLLIEIVFIATFTQRFFAR